ncbi:hypothetical protein J1N35_025364, partial [Gossypium stocksii]
IIEIDSILGKSCWVRDIFLKANHVSNQTLGRINDDSRNTIRWTSDDGWKKVNTDGAVCQLSSSATAGNKVADGLAKFAFSRPLSKVTFMQPLNEILQSVHNDLPD